MKTENVSPVSDGKLRGRGRGGAGGGSEDEGRSKKAKFDSLERRRSNRLLAKAGMGSNEVIIIDIDDQTEEEAAAAADGEFKNIVENEVTDDGLNEDVNKVAADPNDEGKEKFVVGPPDDVEGNNINVAERVELIPPATFEPPPVVPAADSVLTTNGENWYLGIDDWPMHWTYEEEYEWWRKGDHLGLNPNWEYVPGAGWIEKKK